MRTGMRERRRTGGGGMMVRLSAQLKSLAVARASRTSIYVVVDDGDGDDVDGKSESCRWF